MSAIETWRVIFADGAVCSVAVERMGGGFRASRPNLPPAQSDTAHGAVMRLDGVRGWDVAEILSPGQLSRSEMITAHAEAREVARRDGVRDGIEAARAAAIKAAEYDADTFGGMTVSEVLEVVRDDIAAMLVGGPDAPPPCDCSECGGTHRVVGSMGHERACDYCACEVTL